MKDLTSYIFTFENLIRGNFLYVDKTEYIWNMIRPSCAGYFLSRPRRFGKSLTVSTLKAVFEGKKELFKGLAIHDKPYDWKPYPIIHLSLGDYNVAADALKELPDYLMVKIRQIAQTHSVMLSESTPGLCFGELIDKLSIQTPVVILIDEYDKPLLDNVTDPNLSDIQKCLKGFYGILKDRNDKERFLFITGVSKFSHVSLFSELNNLTDISMDARYAAMFGYTQAELEANFADWLQAVADGQNMEELKSEIKKWYDGYRFHRNGESVYNPVSIAKFFENGGEFNNYWFATGTPSFLLEVTKRTHFNFETALKKPVSEIAFNAFDITAIDPLILMFQTGYVTIKSTERKFNTTFYHLNFPNHEVTQAFSTFILKSYAEKPETGVVNFAADMAQALEEDDLEQLRKLMEVFFAGIPYNVHKKNEATFQAIFFALFRLLGEFIEAESCTNDGRIDAVVQTSHAIYLFEFKLDDNPTALEQIKNKQYFRKYLLDKREIHLICVNFDSEKGNLIGWETGKAQTRLVRAKRHNIEKKRAQP